MAGLRLVEFATAMEEQAGLGQRIRTLAEAGALPSSIAVLARTNAHLQVWGRALTVAGIPTTLGTPNYHEVREVRMATAVLRAGALQGEAVDATLIGRPTMDQVRLLLGHVGWRPDRAAGSLGPDAWTAVAALHELARAMVAADPDVTLLAITDRIRAMAAAGEDPPLPAVTLMTLHAAKGMEWDHILLPGLRDGVLPATQATTPALREEERRLLYVGATRARATLWMSWALREGARGPRHQRTPFLDPVVDRWGFQPAAAVDRVPLRGGQRQSGLRRPGGPVRGRDGRFGMDDRRGTV